MSDLVGNSEDRFSHVAAHFIFHFHGLKTSDWIRSLCAQNSIVHFAVSCVEAL